MERASQGLDDIWIHEVTEKPRNLTLAEARKVSKRIALAAAMLTGSLHNGLETMTGKGLEQYLPKIEMGMRYPSAPEVCTRRTPDGSILVEITQPLPLMPNDQVMSPRVITLNYQNYSVQCKFVPLEEFMQAHDSNVQRETVPRPQAASRKQGPSPAPEAASRNQRPQGSWETKVRKSN